MICDDIIGTKRLGLPKEWFTSWINSFKSDGKVDIKKLDEFLLEKASSDNNVLSIKIMANQIIHINNIYSLNPVNGRNKSESLDSFYEAFKDATFAWVTRKDKVAQAVSRLMARKTGVYHHIVEDKKELSTGNHFISNGQRVESDEYRYEEIAQEIKRIEREEAIIEKFLNKYSIGHTKIIYEEAVNSRSYIQDVGRNLNQFDIPLSPRKIKKIGGQKSLDWIARYNQDTKGKH
ncbi:Stf0 family sulfotransferase [Shewanella sp. 6_MG-2023]|uniref:Stf0 family sulfotransferase n=1 Tax=Shewanella sp. 6_MG-2023 TaxID=3062660 RepID=UPI0026E15CD8|nr:Stf0 family sulfotransferase [Shewanella sp. 6_MG-2023]MDO6617617.1 Stf0 family sulfotransferase [Shewanella sp. 6_MG-2023]